MKVAAIKSLIKVVILLVAVVVFLGSVNYVVSMQISNAEEELTRMNAQVMQVKSKLAEIKTEQKIREEAKSFYDVYAASESADPQSFTRDSARANIASMRKRFGLNSIQLNNSGFREVKHKLSGEKTVALASYATIRFSCSYDMPIYEFLAAIEDTLPGVVSISSVNIKRTGTVDDNVLAGIAKGNEVNIVTGDVSFNWFGVVDPTLVAAIQPVEGEEHIDNLKNIFDAMAEVSKDLDKTTQQLNEANKEMEQGAAEMNAAMAKIDANLKNKPSNKLVPINGLQPAKQFGGDKKAPATPEVKTPAPAAATTAKPAPAATSKPATAVKLQSLKPANNAPVTPADKKGGANAN